MADPIRIPDVTETWINSLAIAFFGAVLSLFAGLLLYYLAGRQKAAAILAAANVRLVDRVNDLERQLSAVNQAVVPISAAFQAILVKELTHFHTPEMDGLMAKLGPPFTLTEVEAKRLGVLLEERQRDMNDQISDAERDAAQMLPLVMRRVLVDRERSGIEAEPLVRIMVVSADTAWALQQHW